jgi:hypothetical protein
MKSNSKRPEVGKDAIVALQSVGFTLAEIRPILPRLTGTSIARIADSVGVSGPTVTRTLLGHFGHPRVIQKIATALQIPVEVLFPEKILIDEPLDRIPRPMGEKKNNL